MSPQHRDEQNEERQKQQTEDLLPSQRQSTIVLLRHDHR